MVPDSSPAVPSALAGGSGRGHIGPDPEDPGTSQVQRRRSACVVAGCLMSPARWLPRRRRSPSGFTKRSRASHPDPRGTPKSFPASRLPGSQPERPRWSGNGSFHGRKAFPGGVGNPLPWHRRTPGTAGCDPAATKGPQASAGSPSGGSASHAHRCQSVPPPGNRSRLPGSRPGTQPRVGRLTNFFLEG